MKNLKNLSFLVMMTLTAFVFVSCDKLHFDGLTPVVDTNTPTITTDTTANVYGPSSNQLDSVIHLIYANDNTETKKLDMVNGVLRLTYGRNLTPGSNYGDFYSSKYVKIGSITPSLIEWRSKLGIVDACYSAHNLLSASYMSGPRTESALFYTWESSWNFHVLHTLKVVKDGVEIYSGKYQTSMFISTVAYSDLIITITSSPATT